MKKSGIALVLLIFVPLGYCSLPMASVASLTVQVVDQNDRKITRDASVTFFDAKGVPIVTIKSGDAGSWDHSLHWWAHSQHDDAIHKLRTKDALRTASARVQASGCEPMTIAVQIERRYEALNFSPHGGGPASFHYTFQKKVALRCP